MTRIEQIRELYKNDPKYRELAKSSTRAHRDVYFGLAGIFVAGFQTAIFLEQLTTADSVGIDHFLLVGVSALLFYTACMCFSYAREVEDNREVVLNEYLNDKIGK